jgi:hypothetical protein
MVCSYFDVVFFLEDLGVGAGLSNLIASQSDTFSLKPGSGAGAGS